MRKTGNGTVTRSEESMTLMASYRFSHYDVLSSNRHSARGKNTL
ncbi:hypothetical protein [Dialister invisus]